jgi:HlyD family secretion protein
VVVRSERDLERATKKAGKGGGKAMAAKKPAKPKNGDIFVAAEDDTAGKRDREITGMFVVKDGVAKFVPVRTGLASETMIEVFGDLKAGDLVVSGPYKTLRELKPDQKVRPEPAGKQMAKR